MRFHEKLLVGAAVVFATTAVAANVFAQSVASQERARLSTTTMTFAPIPSHIAADEPSTQAPNAAGSMSVDPDGHQAREHDGPPEKELRNHGLTVRAYIMGELGFVEGLDGPKGTLMRVWEIAKPDIKNDGPPRSDRAQENLESKKPKKDPPGQSRDH